MSRRYTVVLPKPLMPIGEYPILEVIVRQLVSYGFTHITMAVNHQAEIVKAFFQNGERWGVNIDYSLENEPLGTMGPLKLISDLPPNFLVMNGDILSDINYANFYDDHVKNSRLFTISSVKRDQKIDYGVLEVNDTAELVSFLEAWGYIGPLEMCLTKYRLAGLMGLMTSCSIYWRPENRCRSVRLMGIGWILVGRMIICVQLMNSRP